mmetsp:Transcript_67806/g.192190  ORF Transcript_67806/g.192190 Transcript_67806/m.192190 type:complete len:214 (-) Transcript_67806:4069-4710(-)
MLFDFFRTALLRVSRACLMTVFTTLVWAVRTPSVAARSFRSAAVARDVSFVSSTLASSSMFLVEPLKASCCSNALATVAFASARPWRAFSAPSLMASSSAIVGLSPILALSMAAVAFASATSMAAEPSSTDFSAKALALASCTFCSSSFRCCTIAALAVDARFLSVSILDCSALSFVQACCSLDLISERGPCLTLATSIAFLSAASAASTHFR